MSAGSPSFAGLRRAADQLQGSSLSSSNALSSLTPHIPLSFTWGGLASELARPEDEDKPQYVLALRACLEAAPSALLSASDTATAPRRQIRRSVARILALVDDAEYDADVTHGGDNEERRSQVAGRCRAVAEDGLAVLARVGLCLPDESSKSKSNGGDDDDDDDAQALYTVTALADASQPWTTDAAAETANRLLADLFGAQDASRKQQWIVDGILKQYLRPLFARAARPATVTALGRKAAFAGQAGDGRGGDMDRGTANSESPQAKPWKYTDLRAISVFAWAVHEASGELVRMHWPLFIPVLLALVDDPDTAVRARGLLLLDAFVASVPGGGSLLHTTGLDSVLADAVFPTLHFLPRLTPERESLQLLAPAYAALLGLAKAAAAAGASKDAGGSVLPKAAASLLDRMLREGVYSGYFHASEHIRIVEELVRQAGRIVEAMGIYAVKHLKDLMPVYAAILTDPFAMRYKPAVAAAVDALQTTMASCWPRLANTRWQEETTKMLMLSWLHAVEEEEQEKRKPRANSSNEDKARAEKETADLKARLGHAADTLLAILKAAGVDTAAAVGPLVDSEPRLAALFKRAE
ncbi:hypothetical protein SCUCBS95973_003476 [Sporothrix curviconia]|uniref:Uncharacterized protein n=1 Tax=Sporothrix curviconia TaxID=1260050 RepID=A0ABP0BFX7_9PEZI